MGDPLLKYPFYVKACGLYEDMIGDSDFLGRDYWGREMIKQLVRSSGSIPANIEEGYGREPEESSSISLRLHADQRVKHAAGTAARRDSWMQT